MPKIDTVLFMWLYANQSEMIKLAKKYYKRVIQNMLFSLKIFIFIFLVT